MKNGFDRRAFLGGAGMATLSITLPGIAAAQSYPARPITVVIMYAAGGGTDVLIRKLADEMAKARGWNVSIANRPGAVGGIATQYVSAQPADGYNILGAANYNKFVRVMGHSDSKAWEDWQYFKAANSLGSPSGMPYSASTTLPSTSSPS